MRRHIISNFYVAIIYSLLIFPVVAAAQWKPEKTVEFVIGTGTGGAFDTTARVVQRIWKESNIVSANTVVLNKPGAGQTLAMNYLNQFAGDGHYLSVVSGIMMSNYLTGKTKYSYNDFTPLVLLFNDATVFAVNADSPFRSGKDLIERLRKDPFGPSFAVGSTLGSATHIAAALAIKAVGGDARKMKAVVLNSSGDSVTQVLGGHIDVVTSAASLVLPQAQAGKLRMIAVASAQRMKGPLADVPTWKEQGVDANVSNWRAVIGPRGMTAEQIAYWEQIFARTVKTKEWQTEMARSLWEDIYTGSRETRKFLDSENAAMKSILSDLGLTK
jgi:putative tricarboxylic transport membrane protein